MTVLAPGSRVAIVGSGVAGLVCADVLRHEHDVTLYERDSRLGGHAHTVTVEVDGARHAVDTGFIVYNERTYPGFIRLLAHHRVATKPSEMSFSVSDEATGLEWRGSSPATLFAQPRRLVDPRFLGLLAGIARFNKRGAEAVRLGGLDPDLTLAEWLREGGWSSGFVDGYLVPIGASIWSADPSTFLEFPAETFLRFFANHGLLSVRNQPQWRTIDGGSIHYVDAIRRGLRGRVHHAPVQKIVRRGVAGVEVLADGAAPSSFDHVIVATHSDQALRLLADPSPDERSVLGAIRYQPNRATLHTDGRLLPRARRAHASWNFRRPASARTVATLTYDMNRLQGIRSTRPLLVTLNQEEQIEPGAVLATMDYAHPVFDAGAIRAQRRWAEISGGNGVSFAGAYWGHGFHEDGVQSALRVCAQLGVEAPW